MDPVDVAKLNKHRFVLVREMDTPSIVDHLINEYILYHHHTYEINEQQDRMMKNRRLIDILKTRGGEAFQKFLAALYKTNQHHLAALLNEEDQSAISLNKMQHLANYIHYDLHQVLETVQQTLKRMYLVRFQKVYPFSLPFTFDIENTWVSLALKEDSKYSQATEDHAKLLERAFEKVNMLIIEGDPATGKTSLMRRLAYEWAKGKKELFNFDLIVYSEFREVREQSFERIADLLLCYSKNYLNNQDFERLALLMNNKQFCKERHILVLLDGYDESSLEKQCAELSTYLSAKIIRKPLLFNIVMTTKNGYLSNLRGREGRFVYADVLGFTTEKQKKKYISNHFSSNVGVDSIENISAVERLLQTNENFNKLSETPLFLTFICLVYERVIDGTLVELYSNIISWLIDRHQQDFPDRDIPSLCEFRSESDDKFKIIQNEYHQFPQLHRLGQMAVNNLEKSVFKESDCRRYNLKPILEQIGLLRKEQIYDKSYRIITSFSFPHRTIQEFLAALHCLLSVEILNEWLTPHDAKGDMNEYQKFLLRIALSNEMPVTPERRLIYFEKITILNLNLKFDSFCTASGLNSYLLNNCFSQCSNVQKLNLRGNNEEIALHEPINLSKMRKLTEFFFEHTSITCKTEANMVFSFINCVSLEALTFECCKMKSIATLDFTKLSSIKTLKFSECEIEANIAFFFPNCLFLQTLTFQNCKMNNSIATLDFTNLSSIKTLEFSDCDIEANIAFSFPNCLSLQTLTFQNWKMNNNIATLDFTNLSSIKTLEFSDCEIEENIAFSFPNCLSLETLTFECCKMKSIATLDFKKLSSIKTLEFNDCEIEERIAFSFPNCLSLQTLTFQNCKMNYSIATLDFTKLSSIKTLKFSECEIEANIAFFFPNCLSLETLTFYDCKMNNSIATLDFTNLSSINIFQFLKCEFEENIGFSFPNCLSLETLTFYDCKMNNSIATLDFTNLSSINTLKFSDCDIEANIAFSFPNCLSLETLTFYDCKMNNSIATLDFTNLSSINTLKFSDCDIEANIAFSFPNYLSLQTLTFQNCKIKSSATFDFTKLLSVNTLEFFECQVDLIAWHLITDEITSISIGHLVLSSEFFAKEGISDYLNHMQKCKLIRQIDIDYKDLRYIADEKQLAINLCRLVQVMQGLKCITFKNGYQKPVFMKIIKEAGQKRDANFSIFYNSDKKCRIS